MLNNKSNYISLYIFTLLLYILYLTEAYFKIRELNFGETSIILKSVKLLVLLGVSIYILKTNPKTLFWPLMISTCFFIGQVTLKNSFQLDAIIEFSKYLYLIMLLIFFNVYSLSDTKKNKLFFSFEILLVFNSILVLLGYFFDIFVFKTYQGNRFGYNGLLVTSATSTYFYIIGMIYILLKNKINLFKKFSTYIILIAALFVGTKAIYIFLIGYICVFIIYYMKRKILIILFSLIGVLAISLFYYFFFTKGIFNEIRKSDGLLSAIMSYRNQLLVDKTLPFIKLNWHFPNYLFGGISDITTKSQLDIIDVFYCFGIIGGFLFLYVFLRFFKTFKINNSMIFLLSLMFIIVLFAGNFFSYASVAIYIILLREFLCYYEEG